MAKRDRILNTTAGIKDLTKGKVRCASFYAQLKGGGEEHLLPPAQMLEGSAASISIHDFFRI